MLKVFRTVAFVTASLLIAATAARAHTISIGYENAGPGSVNFWFGTYHSSAELPAHEGSFNLVGINGNPFPSTTVPFTLLATSKPSGLIDGTTNFYASGPVGGPGPLLPTNTTGLTVATWQGANFSGLAAGDYRFTYIPVAAPSQKWAPWNDAVRTNTVTLTGEIVGSAVPEPATLTLLALGGVVGAARRYRRKSES